jgi:hypothetical protein
MNQAISSVQPATVSAPFSPITGLMKGAWDMMMQKIGLLFLLGVIYVVASGAGLLVIGGTAFYTMFMTGALEAGFALSLPGMLFVALVACLALVYYLVISVLYSTAGLLILADNEKKSLKYYITQAVPFIIPLSIASFLVSIFQIGGFILFLLPMLFMLISFIFVGYVVVYEKLKPYAALRRSYELVRQHFSDVFMRLVALWVIQIIVLYFIPSLLGDGEQRSVGSGILYMLLSYGMGIYASAYLYILYRETVMRYDATKKASTFWQPIVALIGWIIGILAIAGVITAVINNKAAILNTIENVVEDMQKKTEKQNQPLKLPNRDAAPIRPDDLPAGNEI